MILLLHFFANYAPLIYLILTLGFIFALRGLIRSLRAKQRAIFSLEREIIQGRLRQSIAILILVILLVLTEVILQAFLTPGLPASDLLSTPTLSVLTIPTTTLPASIALGSITPASTPTAAISGCIPGQIMITLPKAGDTLSGDVVITGTADIPDFGFFKYEYGLIGADSWSTILAGRRVVRDGELGHWDTTQLAYGDYLLRLVVTDNKGNALPACVVQVRISNE